MPVARASLSRSIMTIVVALAALATAASLAFAWLTTALHAAGESIESSAESVKLFEEIERDLLLHELSADPRAREQLAAAARSGLALAARYVGGDEEARSLSLAREKVDGYLRADDASRRAAFQPAIQAVTALVDVNVADARQERRLAARYDLFGHFLAGGSAALLAAMVGAVAFWLRRRAFRPVLDLAGAMERFTAGDRTARAETGGPAELSEMSRRFNDLADSQAHQREREMAFLAGIAHDLRNPLSALKCSRGVVRPDRPLPEEPVVRRAFELVYRQVDRMDRLVGDLLDTARIEAGQLHLDKAPRDLRELARASCELFESASEKHRIELEAPADPVIATCDAHRIEQVLDNLLSNAIKYSPAGGVVRVRVRAEAGRALLSVADAGEGIAAEDLQRVFEPFQRAGARDSKIPGMGLGLFVARRIVEGHGGTIGVDSRPGAGTTFEVALPQAEAD